MKARIKVLIFSDAHFSVNTKIEEARWWPPAEKIVLSKIARNLLKRIDRKTQESFFEMINKACILGPFDCVIDLGDGTPGTNQRGLITKKAVNERLRYQQVISANFPKVKMYSTHGNHDVGFYSKSTAFFSLGSQKGYMDKKSFNLAKKIIGLPWDSFKLSNFTFLLLNSEVIRASRARVSPDRSFFEKQVKKQEKFVENVLADSSGQVILAIHDPAKLEFLLPIIEKYQDRVCLTLAGHYHVLPQEKVRKKFPWGKKINFTRIIPNTWGGITNALFSNEDGILNKCFGAKGGFATLELSDGSFKLEYHWL